MFITGNQEIFAIYVTVGFTGHVQVLVRSNMNIYKIQIVMNPGAADHGK